MSGLYGVNRFLPQDFGEYQAPDPFSAQQITPAAQGMAYQPNYNLFWNPSAMLQLGSPQFAAPWYNQTPFGAASAVQPQAQQAPSILGGDIMSAVRDQGILGGLVGAQRRGLPQTREPWNMGWG